MRAVLVFVMLCAPSLGWTQDDPVRRDLIVRAAAARDRGAHAQAIALAREAAARRMSPSLRTFIAEEEEALGQIEAALADARMCVEELQNGVVVSSPTTLLVECQTLVARLASRMGRVRIRVLDETITTVHVNHHQLTRTQWETPIEVDPGVVVVVANAPGRGEIRRELQVMAADIQDVVFENPAVGELHQQTAPQNRNAAPPTLPPTTHQEHRRYGLPIAVLDAAAYALVGGTSLIINVTNQQGSGWVVFEIVGMTALLFGAPAVHLVRGRVGVAFADLGVRIGLIGGLGALGGYLGYHVDNESSYDPGTTRYGGYAGAVVGLTVGVLGASLIDTLVFARESRPGISRGMRGTMTDWVVSGAPTLGGAILNFSATF